MEAIFTPNAPKPGGHYSQAVVHNGFVFVAGQLPVDPETGDKNLGSIEEQTLLVLKNTAAILEAAGSGIDMIIKTTVYVSDIGLWDRVNAVYTEFMGDHKPARAVVPTRDLHFGFQIELETVAAVSEQ